MSSENKTRLDSFLADAGYVKSRTLAAQLIKSGQVTVNGKPCTKPSYTVSDSDNINIEGDLPKYVSRGGLKLEKAIERFNIDLGGKSCIDIGASTGGFTDCMLQHGADRVYAVDVGTAQLDEKLKSDKRVISMEKTDIRNAELPQADFISVDVSFISLKLILPSAYRLLKENAALAALIKPQFEAGKSSLNKNGVVRDEKVHRRVCEEISAFAAEIGFNVIGVIPSPIEGGDGNREFLMYAVKGKGKE
ncbi:MAG: TlyA family RNA methyltransferase [Eubacterium sp.]|nr:TlyA family RNA methyltransferase [Eubacterium sp.]